MTCPLCARTAVLAPHNVAAPPFCVHPTGGRQRGLIYRMLVQNAKSCKREVKSCAFIADESSDEVYCHAQRDAHTTITKQERHTCEVRTNALLWMRQVLSYTRPPKGLRPFTGSATNTASTGRTLHSNQLAHTQYTRTTKCSLHNIAPQRCPAELKETNMYTAHMQIHL